MKNINYKKFYGGFLKWLKKLVDGLMKDHKKKHKKHKKHTKSKNDMHLDKEETEDNITMSIHEEIEKGSTISEISTIDLSSIDSQVVEEQHTESILSFD